LQHLNKKLIDHFINSSFNNNIYIYKTKNVVYFVKEIKRWKEIDLQKRESNGNYLFIARIEINSNKPEGYNFIRQRSVENNIKYVFSLILLNRIYKND
jgi:hypothetical protein